MDIEEEKCISEFVAKRIPKLLVECEFDTTGLDKIFASVWFSKSEVIVGTKCSKVVLYIFHFNASF